MNEYTIVPIVKGFKVSSQKSEYLVAMRMFSLSAKIFDNSGFQIASMKRTSWWKLNYKIEAEKEIYIFSSSAFNDTLFARNANEKYQSNGSTEMYESSGKRITELCKNKSPLGSLSLRVHIPKHQQALILISCLYYKTVIEAPGYAV